MSANGTSVDDVRRALHTLYRSNDSRQQQLADEWLLNLMRQPDAWQLCTNLLTLTLASSPAQAAESLELLMFCANCIGNKVAYEWSKMRREERTALHGQLVQHTLAVTAAAATAHPTGRGGLTSVLHQLARAVAALVLRGGEQSCDQFCGQLIAMAAQSVASADAFQQLCVLYACAAWLSELALQLSSANLSELRRSQLRDEMDRREAEVYQLMAHSIELAVQHGRQGQHFSLPLIEQSIGALLCWQRRGRVKSSCLLPAVLQPPASVLQSLLELLSSLDVLYSPQRAELIEQVCTLASEVLDARDLSEQDESEAALQQQAVQLIYAFILRLLPVLRHCHEMCGAAVYDHSPPDASVPPPPNVDTAQNVAMWLADLLNHTLRVDMDNVKTGEGSSLHLVSTLLSLSSYPFHHRSPTLASLDFWIDLQDQPVRQRHKQLRDPLFRSLCTTLLAVSCYPVEFQQWDSQGVGFAGERDEWRAFRDRTLSVIGNSFALLKEQYVTVLLEFVQQRSGGDWAGWEVVASALSHAADSLHALMLEGKPIKTITPALIPLLKRLLHLPSLPHHSVLLQSTCKCLSDLSFWVCEQHDLLSDCVTYLIHAAPYTVEAGKAFSALMSRGVARVFASDVSGRTAENLLTAVTTGWDKWPPATRWSFCGGSVMVIEQLADKERRVSYLQQLVAPTLRSLSLLLPQFDENSAVTLPPPVSPSHPSPRRRRARLEVPTDPREQSVLDALHMLNAVFAPQAQSKQQRSTDAPSAETVDWQRSLLSVVQSGWDAFNHIGSRKWQRDEDVKKLLYELLESIVLIVRFSPAAREGLLPAIHLVYNCYSLTPQPAALLVLQSCNPLFQSHSDLLAELLTTILPRVLTVTSSVAYESPAEHVELLFRLYHWLSALLQSCAPSSVLGSHIDTFGTAVALGCHALLNVHDPSNHCQTAIAQTLHLLLLSVNETSVSKKELVLKSAAVDQQRLNEWQRFWQPRIEQVVQSLLYFLLRTATPRAAVRSNGESDDDDGSVGSEDDSAVTPATATDVQSYIPRSQANKRAIDFLYQAIRAWRDAVWQPLQAAVRQALDDAKDTEAGQEEVKARLMRMMQLWSGDRKRWEALIEDIRRLLQGEETTEFILAYELAWDEREKQSEQKRRESGGMGDSASSPITI